MKKLLVVFIVLTLCSCENLKARHDRYIAEQNKGKFTVDLNSPNFPAGESAVQFVSPIPFAPLRTIPVEIIFFPVEDAVCLRYKVDTYTYNLFLDADSREGFVNGLAAYNKDFEEKNLRSNSRSTTRNVYGTVHGYLYWRMLSFTLLRKGNNLIDIGYYFLEKSPFFTVTVGEAVYINYSNKGRDQLESSGIRYMYYTKAQAEKIAECFEQQYLESVLPEDYAKPPQLLMPRTFEPIELDVY